MSDQPNKNSLNGKNESMPQGDGTHSEGSTGNENVNEFHIDSDSDTKESKSNEDILDLPSGDALTPKSALYITRASNTRLIILAGSVGSGKTTLLTSIYESFLEGPFGDYLFVGSQTLPAFEKRCHESRLASGRKVSSTTRTVHSNEYWLLHLRIRHKNLSTNPQDLLFMDVSGEFFQEIRDSTEECKRHNIFLRADHFIVLVDGDKICQPLCRDRAVNDACVLIRRLIDAGTLGHHSHVDVLFTKFDIIRNANKNDSTILHFLQRIQEDKLKNPFSSKLAQLNISQIASRPNPSFNSGLERGHGLYNLFKSWIEVTPSSRIPMKSSQLGYHVVREIDQYYFRQIGSARRGE